MVQERANMFFNLPQGWFMHICDGMAPGTTVLRTPGYHTYPRVLRYPVLARNGLCAWEPLQSLQQALPASNLLFMLAGCGWAD